MATRTLELGQLEKMDAYGRAANCLAFSFAPVIQHPPLEIRQGGEAHVRAAERALFCRAMCDRAARRGEYNAAMERTAA